ncbi:MAG: Uncharacterised protein [Crocinitomicaceae bacterium]|nr:MAG: Uncharacterised protein [Crocinitomicaceae bacterium]
MKKYLHIVLIFTLIPAFFNAQYYNRNTYKTKRHEINFGIGGSSCLTDVGGGDSPENSLFKGNLFQDLIDDLPITRSFLFDLNVQSTNFAANFSYLYYLKNKLALRLSLSYAKVSGDDSYSGDFFRRNRALNFNTTIAEGSGIIEFTLIPEKVGNKYNLKNKFGKKIGVRNQKFGVYVFAGIGGFYYDPWGTNKFLNSDTVNVGNGQKYRLRELHTEGQGLEGGPAMFSEVVTGKKYSTYKNFAICIPLGFGIKKAFHSTAGIKLEASYRFTNTDYLDDVSNVYYDRDKLKEQMLPLYGSVLADRAYTMSGTQTGAEYLYVGYATEYSNDGRPIYPDGAEAASDLGGPNPYRLVRTRTEPGFKRGGADYNDSYMFLTFSVYKKLTNTPKSMRIANSGSKRRIKASF